MLRHCQYAHRYLAEVQYRFNRRYDLSFILKRLIKAGIDSIEENRAARSLLAASRANAMTFEKTKESALVVALTNLPNARGFYMMLEQRLAECQRMNNESLAVMSMDVDDFKAINDQYGHAAGERRSNDGDQRSREAYVRQPNR